ncbi:MAG: Holliday junction resolvase RuvX [Bacteroidales bacterium]|jgi:putative Holliday junction resolvase|nr:Holliday junction resolvase RuvX [Bacteroidales bacterium]
MGRILAIDYGRKRTGLAVTDTLQIIAGPLETVPTEQLTEWLKRYVAREAVERIIVGNPVLLNGNVSSMTKQYVAPFIRRLKTDYPDIEVIAADERFTSKMAVQAMLEGGMKKKDRRNKSNIDKLSAAILLQGYLESLKNV